jgi:hypothetical protein
MNMSRGETGASWVDRLIPAADAVALLATVAALGTLAVRAMVRLELRWDTFAYHIPFAAKRAGLGVPYELIDSKRDWYAGFPPLADFVQGALWRLTGSVNATGFANYLAFALFLFFCHRKLGARFWVVALVSLSAPLVVIHAATSYADLFGNALLAIGASSLVSMYLFDRFDDRSLLLWGLFGLAGAAWSKYQMVPLVAVFLVCFLVVYGRRYAAPQYRQLFFLTLAGTLIASAPYLKNIYSYHNPFWPFRLPFGGIPYTYDPGPDVIEQRPPPLRELSQFQLFFHSLLEIHHPTHYPNRERWIIDQGNTWLAFRMGGFWNVAVITANTAIAVLATLVNRRKGLVLLGSMAALLCLVAVLPQSHELRYYQFLPLMWAATIGMLLPDVRLRYPAVALATLCVLLAEFGYVSYLNRAHYRVTQMSYSEAARIANMPAWWAELEPGRIYCAVGFAPIGIMLTGPTMSQFTIIDRTEASLCPANSIILRQK